MFSWRPSPQSTTDIRRFRSFFGTTPVVCSKIWAMLSPFSSMPPGVHPKHLLWALSFLKVYASESVLVSMFGSPSEKTFRKWVKEFVVGISYLETEVVSQTTLFLLVIT